MTQEVRVKDYLTREQKEAIGLLQIGTFLEYFDLMLYVHMAVLLNELFFPKTDPYTQSLIAAFAFCSTYVLRPFGALIFGRIGDTIGRKATVIITTMMMAISCIVMAAVPTYAQIGIAATWIVTVCRIVQGLSSMGEVMGAAVYLTESLKPPAQYMAVACVMCASSVGGMCALGIANLYTRYNFNWRCAFWIGACIAVVGSVARTRLRETPEFIKMLMKKANKKKHLSNQDQYNHEGPSNVNKKDLFAYFACECSYPFIFYISYIYFIPTLKAFGYTTQDVIFHNFLINVFSMCIYGFLVWLVKIFHPLSILKVRANFCLLLFLLIPFLIEQCTSAFQLLLLQMVLMAARGGANPAHPLYIKRIYIGKRFTWTTMNYALSKAIMHVVSSFGLVLLYEYCGHFALSIIGLPVICAYYWSANYMYKTHDWPNDPFIQSKHGEADSLKAA